LIEAQGEKMTKTPGEVEPPKPITKAEREARKAFRQVDASRAMTEHDTAQRAFLTPRATKGGTLGARGHRTYRRGDKIEA
jgi:hypothetical protein